MRGLLFLLLVPFGLCAVQAQDVIVKRDGNTVVAKVLEVNSGEIKYKKFSNQNGPTYTIGKGEVKAINYENGDKDTFEDASAAISEAKTSNSQTTPAAFGVNPNLAEDNQKLVQEFNSRKIELTDKKAKSAKWYQTGVLKIVEGSIMETPEIRLDFSIKNMDAKELWEDGIVATLHNKTNKTIYVDLANCFLLEDGNAHPYYVPTATVSGHGGTTGGSVNLGAVTGALGIGGAAGTLASGINVGGGSSGFNTTTTYSQRIVSIPSNASLSLAPQSVYRLVQAGGYWQGYHSDATSFLLRKNADFLVENDFIKDKGSYYALKYPKKAKGEVYSVPKRDDASISLHITYAFDEGISSSQTMRCSFYLDELIIGFVNSKNSGFVQTPKASLCFRIWGGRLLK